MLHNHPQKQLFPRQKHSCPTPKADLSHSWHLPSSPPKACLSYSQNTPYQAPQYTQVEMLSNFQEVRSVKHFRVWSSRVGQQFHIVYNKAWNHWHCRWLPLLLSLTFSHCLSLCLANCLLIASWYSELSCMLNYASTLPSYGISLVTRETYFCCSFAI